MKDGGVGMKDALATAEGYHEIFRNTDIIKMSTYTSTDAPGGMLYSPTHAALQPGGLVIRLFSNWFGNIPVSVAGNIPQPFIKGTEGIDKPQISSGSETYPLDIAAALKEDKNTVTVSIVNPTGMEQQAELHFPGVKNYRHIKSLVLAGETPSSFNEPGKLPAVYIRELKADKKFSGFVSVLPYSVNLFEFSLN